MPSHRKRVLPLAGLLGIGLSLVAAVVPFGAVAPDASAMLVPLALLATLPAALDRRVDGLHALIAGLLLVVVASVVLRQIPLTVAQALWLAPGLSGAGSLLRDAGGRVTLSYGAFVERSRLALYLAYVLLACAAAHLARRRRLVPSLMRLIVLLGTLQALVGILGPELLPGFSESPFGRSARAVGTFSGANAFGGFIAMTLLVTAGYALAIAPEAIARLKRHWRALLHTGGASVYGMFELPLLVLCAVTQSTALLLSASRGAVLSASAALLLLTVWCALAPRQERSSAQVEGRTLASGLLGIVALGFGGTFAVFYERLMSAFSDPSHAALPRTDIWQRTLVMIQGHPLGIGFGAFGTAYSRYARIAGPSRVYHAHNDYLELLAEGGVVCLGVIVCLLAWLVIVLVRTTGRPGSPTVWTLRACGAAVIAALLHASVDFNLTSRPGVGALFFVLVGAMGGLAADPVDRRHAHTLPRLPVSRRLLLPGLMLGALLLLPGQVRHAAAYRDIERSFTALGGQPDLYRWWPVSPIAAGNALTTAQRAVARAPGYGWGHVMLGRAHTLVIATRQRELESAYRQRYSTVPPWQVSALVTAALAGERRESAGKAVEAFRRAHSITPLDPLPYAYEAQALGLLLPTLAKEGERAAYLDALDTVVARALSLAPNDTSVLNMLMVALASAVGSQSAGETRAADLRAQLMTLGGHLLWLHSASLGSVTEAFQQAGIPLDRMLVESRVPLIALWNLYRRFMAEEREHDAEAVLEQLRRDLEDPHRNLRAEGDGRPAASERQALAAAVARERIRLLLLRGRVAGVSDPDGHPALREAHRLHVERLWAGDAAALSPTARLEALHRQYGLPESLFAQWLDLLMLAGDHATVERELLGLLMSEAAAGERRRLRQWAGTLAALPDRSMARQLYRALSLAETGHRQEAAELMQGVLADERLPVAARPLGGVILADMRHASGQSEARDAALRRAYAGAPNLPVVRERYQMHDLTLPDDDGGSGVLEPRIPLELSFRGGAILLRGITVQPYRVDVMVSFHDQVPSDLVLVVQVLDRHGELLASSGHSFARQRRQAFGAGHPAWGEVYPVTFALRSFGAPPERLRISFRSRSDTRPIQTGYGLGRVEIGNLSALDVAE